MRQNVANCFADAIGPGGLEQAAFDDMLARTAPALEWLRAAAHDRALPHLALPFAQDDLAPIEELAARLRRDCADIVVCGTGGSSLGGQALAQVAGWHAPASCSLAADGPRLHFCDNLDADGYARLLAGLDLARSHFLVISKSGTTPETLAQAIAALSACDAAGLADAVPAAFTILTEDVAGRTGGLKALAAARGLPHLDHPPDLGGRYSALSAVGLLPALLAGLDARAVRAGAAGVVSELLAAADPARCPPAVGAAVNVALAETRGVGIPVLMAYSDRLERFTRWFVQLWAESLGKAGKGTTPLAALGPVDQHSQLQLFLDGPWDKLFTLVVTRVEGRGVRLDATLAGAAGADYLAGRHVGDLVAAMQQATATTLARAGRPVRTFDIESVDAGSVGALMMHFMIETIIAAHLLGVDPFDQPAVEGGKALARDYLAAL